MLREILSCTAIATLIAGVAGPAAAQQTAPAKPAAKWTMPRLADGHPDLQGVWTNKTITPFDRPTELGNKEFFTADEAKAFVKKTLDRNNRDNRTDDVSDVLSAYNAFWWDSGSALLPNLRTSIVIDPRNGRVPPLTAGARRRAGRAGAGRESSLREARVRRREQRHAGAVRRAAGARPDDALCLVRHRRADAADGVQQQLPDRAD